MPSYLVKDAFLFCKECLPRPEEGISTTVLFKSGRGVLLWIALHLIRFNITFKRFGHDVNHEVMSR